MLDKIWESIESSPTASVYSEILAWTYMNPRTEEIKSIHHLFDQWKLENFERIVDEVLDLPPLEGEAWTAEEFGEIGIMPYLIFNQAANLSVLPEVIWQNTSKFNLMKKKKFF